MRITRVEIERFLGLRDVGIDITSNFQVIAGANNSGKTSLLKAIELFFGGDEKKDTRNFQPRNVYYQDEGARSLTRIRLHFGDLSEVEKQRFQNAMLKRKSEFWCECRISRKGNVSYESSRGAPGTEVHKLICDCFGVIYVPAVRVGHGVLAVGESQRLIATAREVLVRSRPGPSTELQKSLEKSVTKLNQIVKGVLDESGDAASEILPDGTELTFAMPDTVTLVNRVLEGVDIQTRTDISTTLRDEGTGLQSLLSLGLLDYVASKRRARNTNVLFLVEEPEAFLHPQYQRVVADHLTDISTRAQVFVTTHSPIIVNSVPITTVVSLMRNPAGLKIDWRSPQLTDPVAGLLARYCDAKNSELVFADKVIFCEGPTDAGVIRVLTNESLGYHHSHENLSIVEMGSNDNAPHFITLAQHFAVPYLVVLDKDTYAAQDRKITSICKVTGSPLTDPELLILDSLKSKKCSSLKEAAAVRAQANEVLAKRNIFCLSADIEAAVAFSYVRDKIIDALGPGDVAHLNSDNVGELKTLNGEKFDKRLTKLVGSKGWNTTQSDRSHKPKPHVLQLIVSRQPSSFRKHSDLAALVRKIRDFLGGA